ncbi:hypothetical protein O9929_22755 [Vibrio lentus]|nr:hypothetical protein [Vibrio lentus]
MAIRRNSTKNLSDPRAIGVVLRAGGYPADYAKVTLFHCRQAKLKAKGFSMQVPQNNEAATLLQRRPRAMCNCTGNTVSGSSGSATRVN